MRLCLNSIKIGKEAFAECSSLTNLKIPNNVKEIGDKAFYHIDTIYYNGKLNSSNWGSNKVINNYIHHDLIEVTLDETVLKQLGYEVGYFDEDEDCVELLRFKKDGEDVKDLVIPSTYIYDGQKYKITKIGDSAFRFCDYITSVTIPDSVTEIGNKAFSGCIFLEVVFIKKICYNK